MCVGAHLLEGCQSLHGGVKIGLSDGQSFIRQGCERRDPRARIARTRRGRSGVCLGNSKSSVCRVCIQGTWGCTV